jgi:5-formyltetrahydrofolate cyclo-ligase
MATAGEVDLDGLVDALLRAGRSVWLPRFRVVGDAYEMVRIASLADDVGSGAFGIREPCGALPALPIEERCARGVLWLVPGVAFDPAGNRLGRGRGYYDRLLHGVRGVRVGVAWDWQVIAQVPHTDRDEPMNWIVTDTRTIACSGPAG